MFLNPKQASGRFVTRQGEKFYLIENYDAMQPFFISLASDTDLWMYISSTGGLTCGRKSPDQALFPYYTDDKITECFRHTGPATVLKVTRGSLKQAEADEAVLWEPFSDRYEGVYDIQRNILKSVTGNKLIFEETNRTLGMTFSYLWTSCDAYGWVRKATIHNDVAEAVEVEFVDGLQNVLPAGTDRVTQNTYSTLVDGYKKTEIVDSLALFQMEAIMVDRAEPSESLRCNTIQCVGLDNAEDWASNRQLQAFCHHQPVHDELVSKGVRGAIFIHSRVALMADAEKSWYFLADVEKDASAVLEMLHNAPTTTQINEAVRRSTETLYSIVAQNDGVQITADEHANARHFANVLFNTMRGGFYVDNYMISGPAFAQHVRLFNHAVADRHAAFLDSLPQQIERFNLLEECLLQNDPQLNRLFEEYLPLTFSRRHGDPSRPWNLFSIRVNDAEGKRLISYQGNWRDIFQNWEALSHSYPLYIHSIIAKFLNATTVDGYNPYKITSEGIDWEVINPDDPWSNIGYWGDHQIIYLLKLLEFEYAHGKDLLMERLNDSEYAFANVPYRLKSYAEIVKDPKNSITFDEQTHRHILNLIPSYGQDARLLLDEKGEVVMASFGEKLLTTFLSKVSNTIPYAGVWMNTLRPEWNDANNALVGNGASMVTLCYMRRFAAFCMRALSDVSQLNDECTIAVELHQLLLAYHRASTALGDQRTPQAIRQFVDTMGLAGEQYRQAAYAGLSGKKITLDCSEIYDFYADFLALADKSIRANIRKDGLYNAYNTIQFTTDGITIQELYPMLEGQVAVLSSFALSPEEVTELLHTLRHSDLYREDQRSYMLYPNRLRPSFFEKNNVPESVMQWPEYADLLQADILREDCEGGVHFNPGFNNADFMRKHLSRYPELSKLSDKLSAIYEQVFNHHAFTGRSGTFYKYEGLGSIYWHMVSKLLLAVGENIQRAFDAAVAGETLGQLIRQYREIQEGIGAHKQPAEYGSFPFDPYSHTPSMAGVQQPGMTGQVKEDILSRWMELGLRIQNGTLSISPLVKKMLSHNDFIQGRLRFSYCGTQFEYVLSDHDAITCCGKTTQGLSLDLATSRQIFFRSGEVEHVQVELAM
ncbi:MAG: hypothetical protein MJZ89_02905 [Paludibacteraceae bacterium]|nr:hypothetical protein [Paludibacteraceae bacterium]